MIIELFFREREWVSDCAADTVVDGVSECVIEKVSEWVNDCAADSAVDQLWLTEPQREYNRLTREHKMSDWVSVWVSE